MDNLVQVLLMALFFIIIGSIVMILSFIYKMLHPKFRKQYFILRDICKEIKLTGNLELLQKFIQTTNSDKLQYSFYYEKENRISDNEIYNSNYDNRRKNYIKIIATANHYSLENCLGNALIKNKKSDKFLIKYLINEIYEISHDFKNEDFSDETKILKSKQRFISYLCFTDSKYKNNISL